VEVGGLNGEVLAISAGGIHTCALMADGTVKCWGIGELVPVDVNGLDSDVAEISAGGSHTCALTTSGGLKCWGSNLDGQLGVGSNMPSGFWDATDVVGLTNGVAAVTAGGDSSDAYTCALLSNGDVQCWGSNDSGQLGYGFGSGNSTLMSVIFNP
jgi:alpha-tubulin suppressor-like RCC1 family protein